MQSLLSSFYISLKMGKETLNLMKSTGIRGQVLHRKDRGKNHLSTPVVGSKEMYRFISIAGICEMDGKVQPWHNGSCLQLAV